MAAAPEAPAFTAGRLHHFHGLDHFRAFSDSLRCSGEFRSPDIRYFKSIFVFLSQQFIRN
jgi:hypothetical protein